MADDLTIDEGTSSKKAHTKERAANIHNPVVEVNIGGASEVLASGDGTNGLDVDVTRVSGNVTVIQGTAASLNMTEANSGAIKTAVELIDNAISGSEMQVDVVTQPSRTVGSMIQWSHYSNEYSTAQTSQDLVALSGTTKIYVGRITISTGGTTAGLCTIYFGTGAYSAGTSKTVFRGNFAPSATAYPGVVIGNGAAPFVISGAGDALKITTSAAMTVYVQVDYIQV